MKQRDRQPAILDASSLPPDQYELALTGLARMNRFSGVARATFPYLRHYANAIGGRPLRILDVASGSGDVPIFWARRARREGLRVDLTLLDISDVAAEEQQRRAREANLVVNSVQLDCLRAALPAGFDVVTCSLFMHHLADHQAFRLLQSMQAATEHALVVCDLERSRLNLEAVRVASHLLSRSSVVHHDALSGVRAAYTRDEFKQLAEVALMRPVRVSGFFPCRFLATFGEDTVSETAPSFA